MPAGKSSQSNAMMYAVITFVALFLIAATCAVLFYIKSTDFKTQNDDIKSQMGELASESEQRGLTKTIGKREGNKSYLGIMTEYLNDLTSAVTGEMPEDTPISTKVNTAKLKINEMMEALGQDATAVYGPEGVDLIQTISTLKSELDTARDKQQSIQKMLTELQEEFDIALDNFRIEEKRLIEEKNHYQKEADRIQADYDSLEAEHEKSADDQIKSYMTKLKKAENTLKDKNQQIQGLEADLKDTKRSLKDAIGKLEMIKPRPDIEVAAFRPDAGVVSIDMQTNTVFLDIGSNDHVYVGLTFSIYDKNTPVPEDGIGKAQVEVFGVTETVSAAKIITSSRKNPIVEDDIAVNLVWDSATSNSFVVAGMFDFDGDGRIDHDGREKIIDLIKRWGGEVTENVTIDTDFVVLGYKPKAMRKPTIDDIEENPMIEQKYKAYLKKYGYYQEILARTGTFSIPVFNQDRFLYLIGFETLASKSSPF